MKTRIATLVLIQLAVCGCSGTGSDTTGLPGALLPPDVLEADAPTGDVPLARYTYVACLADPHIVLADDEHAQNLRAVGQTLAGLPYDLKGAFIAGDIVFNLPYDTLQAYHDDPNDRFDIAEEILDGFPVPVHVAIGNHDQDIGEVDALVSRQLFREHFGAEPYYAVDLGTWKFLILSNFLGPTQDPQSPEYDLQTGSLGAEQTAWLEDQLSDGRPTILMLHFPPFVVTGLTEVLARHTDTARLVLAGHSHSWVNLSDHYAVPAMVVGSSQYDPDSFLILELDNELRTWRILDWDRLQWGTSYATPFAPEG